MECVWCGNRFEPRTNGGKPQRFCSATCRKRLSVAALKERDPDYYRRWYRNNKDRWNEYASKQSPVIVQRKNRKWRRANPDKAKAAVKNWVQKNPDQIRRYSRERTALKRSALVESFAESEIFERDRWICQLCGQPVDPSEGPRHPKSKSLDHIIPLTKGGLHTRENTQLAHLGCNSAKGNRGAS